MNVLWILDLKLGSGHLNIVAVDGWETVVWQDEHVFYFWVDLIKSKVK